MKYTYSSIRFVPDPVKGEFVNLGLIVGSDETGDWRIETIENRGRARKLDESGKLLPSVVAELERIEAQIDSAAELEDESVYDVSRLWLTDMAKQSRGIIQYSPPKPVLADDVDQAIEILWSRLVVDSEVRRRTAVTRKNLRARFRSALSQRLTATEHHFKEHVTLQASQSRSEIDFALHNGKVKQLTQCWSLQLQDTDRVLKDIKSWAWTIRGLRHSGGTAVSGDERYEVPSDVNLKVIYAKPSEPSSSEVVDEAVDAFSDGDVNAEFHEFTELDAVADSAAKTLEV